MRLRSIKKNMTEVVLGDLTILFSYETPVACHIQGKGYFRTSKRWSATTTRHINQWLDGAEAEERPQKFFDNLLQSEGVK